MSTIAKIGRALAADFRSRGFLFAFLLHGSHLIAAMRGMFYKLLYGKRIRASGIFSLQANSRIEIFNKRARVVIGRFVFIRKNASLRLDFDGVLELGDKVFINDNCNVNCVHRIVIGEGTKIAPHVSINDHDHNYRHDGEAHLIKGEVIIGRNVWIGSNVVILRDTHIGDNAVIAAGSVVKGVVPANTVFLNKREKKLIPYGAETAAAANS